jgi:hypothetical protein
MRAFGYGGRTGDGEFKAWQCFLARLNAPNAKTFGGDTRFVLDTLPALTARPTRSSNCGKPYRTSPCKAI